MTQPPLPSLFNTPSLPGITAEGSTGGTVPEQVQGQLAVLDRLPPNALPGARASLLALPGGPVSTLLSSVEHGLGSGRQAVILFVSAYAAEGAGTVAFESALTASRSGKRVLFLDTAPLSRSVWGRQAPTGSGAGGEFSLGSFLAGEGGESPFWLLEGTTLCCASLPEGSPVIHGRAALQALFIRLRQIFDMVVVHAESGLSGGAIASYASLMDGVVIVAEAERLREPVARQLKEQILSNGGRILGAVLNRRRFYIPAFLYALLYRSRR